MKIESVQIQNFRSIQNATLVFKQVLAVVGQNNVGKSHILRALNVFFNFSEEKKDFENLSHQYSPRSSTKISIVFDDVVNPIFSSISSQNKMKILFSYKNGDDEPKYKYYKRGKYLDLSSVQKKRLLEKFKYVYVPIVRDYNTTILGEHGIAYRLLKKIFDQQIENRDTINPFLDSFYSKMEKTVFKNTLKQIKHFYPFSNDCEFELKRKDFDLVDQLLKNLALKLIEKTQSVEIGDCGSGIQSAIYFAISLAHAVDEDVDYLVGIDEPELNMHPQAQRELAASLLDKSKYPRTSFVLTTHSTVIIDELSHDAIVLCRKKNIADVKKTRDFVGKRSVYTEITQISSNFWQKYNLDPNQYERFFEFKNSDFFYSNYVVITESPNDCRVYEWLIRNNGVDPEKKGITFISLDGVLNIKYPYTLAKDLKIPFIAIVDRDVIQQYSVNNKRKESLDSNSGLPIYKTEYNSSFSLTSLFSASDVRNLNTMAARNDYKKENAILKKYSLFSLKYALEVDLLADNSFTDEFCDIFNITDVSKRNAKSLLLEKGEAIKNSVKVINALQRGGMNKLPESYKDLIKFVKELLKK